MYYISMTHPKFNIDMYLVWVPVYKKFAWINNKKIMCVFLNQNIARSFAFLCGGSIKYDFSLRGPLLKKHSTLITEFSNQIHGMQSEGPQNETKESQDRR